MVPRGVWEDVRWVGSVGRLFILACPPAGLRAKPSCRDCEPTIDRHGDFP